MRPYLALCRATAKSILAYRLQFILSLVSALLHLFAMLAVWHALLDGRALGGMTWPKMRVYLLVAFASGALVSQLSDFRTSAKIRNGQVGLDLVKPVDYQTARLAETLGALTLELVSVVLVSGVVVVTTGIDLTVHASPELLLFACSMVLLVLLKFCITYLTGLLCFWTKNYLGIYWARLAVMGLLSGALIPISLMPSWLAPIAQWSPFAGVTSTPGLILIGNASGLPALRLVAVQLGWTALLWCLGRLAWRGALRQLTIQGG